MVADVEEEEALDLLLLFTFVPIVQIELPLQKARPSSTDGSIGQFSAPLFGVGIRRSRSLVNPIDVAVVFVVVVVRLPTTAEIPIGPKNLQTV